MQGGWDEGRRNKLEIQPAKWSSRVQDVFHAVFVAVFINILHHWPSTSRCIGTKLPASSATRHSVAELIFVGTWDSSTICNGKKPFNKDIVLLKSKSIHKLFLFFFFLRNSNILFYYSAVYYYYHYTVCVRGSQPSSVEFFMYGKKLITIIIISIVYMYYLDCLFLICNGHSFFYLSIKIICNFIVLTQTLKK